MATPYISSYEFQFTYTEKSQPTPPPPTHQIIPLINRPRLRSKYCLQSHYTGSMTAVRGFHSRQGQYLSLLHSIHSVSKTYTTIQRLTGVPPPTKVKRTLGWILSTRLPPGAQIRDAWRYPSITASVLTLTPCKGAPRIFRWGLPLRLYIMSDYKHYVIKIMSLSTT
jgi:hypothetical protein